MFVKRYLVEDMQEAMSKIRSELGEDAMILNSRYVRQKGLFNMFKKKKLEVVAAYESKGKKKPEPKQFVARPGTPQIIPPAENGNFDQLNEKIDELQKTIAGLAGKMTEAKPAAVIKETEQVEYSYEVNSMYHKMLEQDVEQSIAKEIAEEVEKVTSKMEVEPSQVMEQQIIKKLGEGSPINIKKYKRNIIMFLGSTGVGKTTTLVKLAGHYVCEEGLKVGIINTDTFRVAAKEQLNIYSEILQIPMDTAYTPEELKEALKNQDDRDLIFMDTTGRSFSDEKYRNEFEEIIKTCEPDEIYVVLSLTTGYSACKKIIDDVSFLGDYKIVLTKLDEAGTYGNILNITDYSKKNLSYITNGQNIPDDIEKADVSKIAAGILKQGENV